MSRLTVLAPMIFEAAALRRGLHAPAGATAGASAGASAGATAGESAGGAVSDIRVVTVGVGPGSARRASARLGTAPGPVLVAGVAGALAPGLRPGDIVLASELRDPAGAALPCADPAILAGILRAAGLRVHVGPLVSSPKVVAGAARTALAQTGALAVDMESVWLAHAAGSRPLSVLRVVLDTPERELGNPLQTLVGFTTALRSLRAAAAQIPAWTDLFAAREVVLAAPRASCAGVDRAVEIVERVLADRGAPVYVRKQIVHNAHGVAGLEARGAVFVDELDEVPPGATAIFSAHGVSPAVRAHAGARDLRVVDATCPLVAKVHAEARRFAAAGHQIVLIGHAGHEEVEGTVGEAPDRTQVIASPGEVDSLAIDDPARVAYLTQTTLAIDETADVVDALKARFPAVSGPASSDICYATQNRQDAVRALAADCDLVLVVGSRNSSNSLRLVEVARRAGARAELVEDATQLSPALIATAARIGLSAGASAPETLVAGVVSALRGLGDVALSERTVAREEVHFKLPLEVRSTEVITCPSP
jgi:4-hydroxy-3-methylbut-2-enyl diphosphate reductase